MDYVIDPPSIATLPVAGDERRFPVRRIYCVGRNYAAHAREMGHDPDREPPFFFTKPADALVPDGARIPYPLATRDLHHEVELVVALGKGGAEISAAQAQDCIFGYAVGIDLTRRDLQGEAKKLARPWDVGKAFDQSAPCSALVPARAIGHPAQRPDPARGQRQHPPGRRSRPDDLDHARGHRASLAPVHAGARRSDLHRHARGRRPGRARRRAGGRGRGRRPASGRGGLSGGAQVRRALSLR